MDTQKNEKRKRLFLNHDGKINKRGMEVKTFSQFVENDNEANKEDINKKEKRKNVFKKAKEKLKEVTKRYGKILILPILLTFMQCASIKKNVEIRKPIIEATKEALIKDEKEAKNEENKNKASNFLFGVSRVQGKNFGNELKYNGASISILTSDRLFNFSVSLLFSNNRFVGREKKSLLKVPDLPEELISNDMITQMLIRAIENQDLITMESEKRVREVSGRVGLYFNAFSLLYPKNIENEKLKLRFYIMPGIEYSYTLAIETTKYTFYGNRFLTEDKKGKMFDLSIPFTNTREYESIDMCLKLSSDIAILNLYLTNCFPIKNFRHHMLYYGAGVIF